MRISVIGAGSWGSALAELAGRCEHEVMLWAHDPRVAEAIAQSRSNPVYLKGAEFSPLVQVTNSLAEAAQFSDTMLMVTPSHHFRQVLSTIAAEIDRPIRVVSGTKGIENETLARISEISADVLGSRLEAFATLGGPSFADEVSRQHPTAAVIASTDEAFAAELQAALSMRTFRLYTSDDVVGVEIGGALKNVVAIAAGVVEGIGFGSNTTAALITRGLHEIRRLGLVLGARAETFAGLAGMGDLVLTCTGSLSRNRSVGVKLGQGQTLEAILSEMRVVAEGVRTCRSAKDVAVRAGVEMPIVSGMYEVLYENADPREAIDRLMTRSLKPEA
jgi:glycerol-3-phosphate dehydrogenase (NAD(P)+)